MLADALAGELGVKYFRLNAGEIVAGVSGESEERVRALFREAKKQAPAIIFIDQLDAVATKREDSHRDMDRRLVSQLAAELDGIAHHYKTPTHPTQDTAGAAVDPPPLVAVLAATSHPDAIDPSLRTSSRFGCELALRVPSERAREQILRTMLRPYPVTLSAVEFSSLAKRTPGFVGADLAVFVREAAAAAVDRRFTDLQLPSPSASILPLALPLALPLSAEQLNEATLTMADFESVLPQMQPSSTREGFAAPPDVRFEQIGALSVEIRMLMDTVVHAITHHEVYAQAGASRSSGVVLWGPPGVGKTMLAKAVANACHANFIAVRGPELLNKFVGESERGVRQVFERASLSSPCIVFFDELDALAPIRDASSGSPASDRVVAQLLTELDGLVPRQQVFVIAATNRLDMIDPAVLRPGRLGRHIELTLPNADARADIARKICAHIPCLNAPVPAPRPLLGAPLSATIDQIVDFCRSDSCDRFSGADLAQLLQQAGTFAARDAIHSVTSSSTSSSSSSLSSSSMDEESSVLPPGASASISVQITMAHLAAAQKSMKPSVSKEAEESYRRQRAPHR